MVSGFKLTKGGTGTLLLTNVDKFRPGTLTVNGGSLIFGSSATDQFVACVVLNASATNTPTLLLQNGSVFTNTTPVSVLTGTNKSPFLMVNGGTIAANQQVGTFNVTGSGSVNLNVVNSGDSLVLTSGLTMASVSSTGASIVKTGARVAGPHPGNAVLRAHIPARRQRRHRSVAGVLGHEPRRHTRQYRRATVDLNSTNNTFGSMYGGGASGGNVLLGTAALTVGGDNSTGTYAGAISGTGSVGLTKIGAGTLILSGINTYSGISSVNGGTLVADTTTNASVLGASSPLSLGGVPLPAQGQSRHQSNTGTRGTHPYLRGEYHRR